MESAAAVTDPAAERDALRAALAVSEGRVVELTRERDRLRVAYETLKTELELLRRRIYVAKAERVDTAQLELEFSAKLAELNKLVEAAQAEDQATAAGAPEPPARPGDSPRPKSKRRGGAAGTATPKGRRNLAELPLTEITIPVVDPVLEALVAEGKAERIGTEVSYKLGWQKAGPLRVAIRRVTYRRVDHVAAGATDGAAGAQADQGAETAASTHAHAADADTSVGDQADQDAESTASAPATESDTRSTPAESSTIADPGEPDADPAARDMRDGACAGLPATRGTITTAPVPAELFKRCLAAPSLLAHIATEKFCDGIPLHRIADRMLRDGLHLDRGTMSRWMEDLGATLGATVIAAAREHALRTAFCLATDATGVLVQPEPSGKRQPCRRGHFFVVIADRDHIFFEYTPKEDGKFVSTLFHGFSGYIQADAKSVYDCLFNPSESLFPDAPRPTEVGCWAHARRKFWEAAVAKSVIGREGLARIGKIFELDASWRDKPPGEITRLRQTHLAPHVHAFFQWVEAEFPHFKDQRGLVRSALGYCIRQKVALLRILENGRLPLDNNRSERALRAVAVGRKNWLFVGSDDHGIATGHLLSAIASARLHGLNPEAYLRDMIRVIPHWPRDRYLELTPLFWAATRARLAAIQLEAELGPLMVPPPLPPEKQPSPS